MQANTTHDSHDAPSEAKPDLHEHLIVLDRVRHQKLIQMANEHRLSQPDLIIKALDAFLAAPSR